MTTVDYPKAIGMFVPDNFVFTDALLNTKNQYAIVIHKTGNVGTAPTAQQQGAWFGNINQNPGMSSVHFVIGQDGTIVQCVQLKDGAGGNCCLEQVHDPFWDSAPTQNLNLCTFSIEHCSGTSNGDNSDVVTQEQKTASFELVQYLVNRFNIPITHIKGHNTIDPINRKNCPGNYPMQELFNYLTGAVTSVNIPISGIQAMISTLQSWIK